MKALAEQISELDAVEVYGRVVGVRGLLVEVAGPIHAMSVGARVLIETGAGPIIPCEVVGFTGANALLMPFAALDGVRRGCRAVVASAPAVRPSAGWLCRGGGWSGGRRYGRRPAGLAGWSMRWGSQSMAVALCRQVGHRMHCGTHRRPPIH